MLLICIAKSEQQEAPLQWPTFNALLAKVAFQSQRRSAYFLIKVKITDAQAPEKLLAFLSKLHDNKQSKKSV